MGAAASITKNLSAQELEQLVIIAKHSALYRILMGVTLLEDLPEDVLITMADFQLALADVKG
jgi:hypothetical protein